MATVSRDCSWLSLHVENPPRKLAQSKKSLSVIASSSLVVIDVTPEPSNCMSSQDNELTVDKKINTFENIMLIFNVSSNDSLLDSMPLRYVEVFKQENILYKDDKLVHMVKQKKKG